MIDTVRFEQERIFTGGRIHKGLLTLDKKSDLRVNCAGDRIKAVEVSLPKLHFGTNDRLIAGQQEIDAALLKVDSLLDAWTEPATTPKIFKRVDLVWHFQVVPPQDFISAHQYRKHPEIKKLPTVFQNAHVVSGVEWPGDRMKIKFYDKSNYNDKMSRQVVRVEIQLRGRKLKNKLRRGREIHSLDLMNCYECYRATLRKFRLQKTVKIGSKDEALFYAEVKGVRVFHRLAASMHKKSLYRLRLKFGKYLLEYFKVNWDKLLPANSLPKKIDAGPVRCPTKFNFKTKKNRFRFKKKN